MSDQLFRQFITTMNEVIVENNQIDGRGQAKLLNSLFKLESEFRRVLLQTKHGKEMYLKFMSFITDDKKNLLSARPYFRERQNTLSKKVAKAFEDNHPEVLYKFRLNFLFAQWVVNNWGDSKTAQSLKQNLRLKGILGKISKVRNTLCENNLPLAINRSKIFWSKNTQSHIQYMDLIQSSAEGLLTAIDKFVPPYKTVFRTTAIGRMTLNMTTENSSTLIKVPPRDKRILYRANNARNKAHLSEDSQVVDYINQKFGSVTSSSLAEIENATLIMASIDEKPDNAVSLADKLSNNVSPETGLIEHESASCLFSQINKLTIFEQKIIYLKVGG